MASIERVNELLTAAAGLIDAASGEIRDAPLEPVRENIKNMGHALASIFEVQQRIYAQHPNLMPEYLKEPSPHPEANIALAKAMFLAKNYERDGDFKAAISEYERFLAQDFPDLHQGIAKGEIGRIRGNGQP